MEAFIEHSHISKLLLAVLPHMNNELHPLVSAIVCIADLSGCNPRSYMRQIKHMKTDELFSCDKEILFNSLRPVCNPSERRILDLFQNIANMKKFYEMYQMMSALMPEGSNPFMNLNPFAASDSPSFTETSDFTSADDFKNPNDDEHADESSNFTNMLEGMLTAEQKSTFDMLKTLFNQSGGNNEYQ